MNSNEEFVNENNRREWQEFTKTAISLMEIDESRYFPTEICEGRHFMADN